MAFKYKLKCIRCKKNYQLASRRDKWVLCYECHKPEMEGKIEDPEMKKMFDIPEQFYIDNMFLRDIKIKHLKYGELSEAQVNAFKKVVDKMKEVAKEEKE